MSDPFVHLHVASGYSLRHGASHPHVLVARAAEHGMDTLGITDRDGLYGVVRLASACLTAGLRPVIGVDLALAEPGQNGGTSAREQQARRNPVRGGAFVEDPAGLRVTVLAVGRRGYAWLCRLVSATQLSGERSRPVCSLELIAEHVAGCANELSPQGTAGTGALVVLLGPSSDVGRALAARRPDQARARLARWRAVMPPGDLQIEVVHHRGAGDLVRAGRFLGFAEEEGLSCILTNVVRYADSRDAPVADVLDAARRLVPLDARHIERTTAEAYLKSGKEMAEIADEVAGCAGATDSGHRLLARTRALADRCALDPRADLGIGELHFPELEVSGGKSAGASGNPAHAADAVLRAKCEAGLGARGMPERHSTRDRLDTELSMIAKMGYAPYFLTVADVTDLIRTMGVRAAARGSGAGSLVTFLTGVSDVDPIRYGLLMERFLSPLRKELPDIDIDVESARRTEVYERVLARYGGDRCACVAMMDTYRARHAVRDVGAALGLPPGEIDTIAKAFPHIRASQLRAALRDLPELRASGLGDGRLDILFGLAERLDGLPRHIALHPCGVLLSDRTLLDRTPVEASYLGFPMSQFDKDDVETLGLLKLDILGIRMQSAISHALGEIKRLGDPPPDIDNVSRNDPATFALIQSTRTLGCFQIESPGQRELIGKFGPENFEDLITDISLFRPGPVKSDMIRPFLAARKGWTPAVYPHPDLQETLAETFGVVVFHEQILQILHVTTGCSLAYADEVRRALGDPSRQPDVHDWFFPIALDRGYDQPTTETIWQILKAFGSFGFCKAHAAAFAVPTYQSAWLKAHHTAAFLAGVLTHDPGMYPKRLILDDARQFGIAVLQLDVNLSGEGYHVERVGPLDEPPPQILDQIGDPGRGPRDPDPERVPDPDADPDAERGGSDQEPEAGGRVRYLHDAAPEQLWPPGLRAMLPDARGYGIRLGLLDVKGISAAEISRLLAGRPYSSLSDCWYRAAPSRPIAERLVLAGGFDSLYGLGSTVPVRRRGRVTRRDLLLQLAELDLVGRAAARAARGGRRAGRSAVAPAGASRADGPVDTRLAAAGQSRAAAAPPPVDVQLALDFDGGPGQLIASGLPEMTAAEQVRAELDILGLDAGAHVLGAYQGFLSALGVTRARDLLGCRSQADVLIAGVKVATQTPPIRSGRRVVFVTLDDSTGPVDATLFEEAQAGYAGTVFNSWLLVIRGRVRRTGPRGVSLLALACWELPILYDCWQQGGLGAVRAAMADAPGWDGKERALHGAADSRSTRPVVAAAPPIVYATGFRQSPYADIKPMGTDPKAPPRKLWHASPGSSGR